MATVENQAGVDALVASRPIVERLGFVPLTGTTPHVRDRSRA